MPPMAGSDTISKLLTETDVYVKYGLHEKAVEHLRKVLAVDPQSPEAHERAREIHMAAGRHADAGDSGVAAVRALLARGQPERAREAFHRLRQIDPGNPALPGLASACGATEELSIEAEEIEELTESPEVILDPDAARPASPDADALALDAAGHDSEELVAEEDPGGAALTAEVDEGIALEVAEPEPQEDAPELVPEVAVAPAPLVLGPPMPRPAPAPPRAEPPRAEPPPAVPASPPVAAKPAALRPSLPVARAPEPQPPPPEEVAADAAEEEADLGDELEEADFFLQQGLLDEAREALKTLLQFYPGHGGLEAKLAEVARRAAAARPAPAHAGAPREPPAQTTAGAGGEDGFDIARELAEELGDAPAVPSFEDEFQYSVEDVFSQFKKGVEATVKPEDSATHYDLGIAYKEMGLLDDALHEFETALHGNDRKKEIDCLTMLGMCRMAKEDPRGAIAAYRRALASEFLTRESAKALHFDLGAAYQAAGEDQVALYYLRKVARVDPAFRDALARAKALGGGPGKPPPEGEARPTAGRPLNGTAAAGHPPPPGAAPVAARAPAAGTPPKKNIGYL
jgi:tetratricopeptide (TPR) repeat protein